MLQQRPNLQRGCDALLDPTLNSVVVAACGAALKLRKEMQLFGKPAPDALASCLGTHFNHPAEKRGDVSDVSYVAWLAERYLAPRLVHDLPTEHEMTTIEVFGAAFSAAFLLLDLQVTVN